MVPTVTWRGAFTTAEVEGLHAEAFGPPSGDPPVGGTRPDWRRLVEAHSLGWGTARADGRLLGFVNVPWDGFAHAWLQDVVVAAAARRGGLGRRLVTVAVDGARQAGCRWLHVDFAEPLRPFYLDACGFRPTAAGLLAL